MKHYIYDPRKSRVRRSRRLLIPIILALVATYIVVDIVLAVKGWVRIQPERISVKTIRM